MEKTDPKEQFERKETVLVRSPFLRYNKLKVQRDAGMGHGDRFLVPY